MTTTPEQQEFCCAVVEDGGEHTIRWLHSVCHDYRDRTERMEEAIELAIAFHSADTQSFVARYGHGYTTKNLCDSLRLVIATQGVKP